MLVEIAIGAGAAVSGWILRSVIETPLNWYWGRKQDLNEWYEQSISLVSHSKGICDSFRKREDMDYGEIANESRKISLRLKEHLNPHPDNADEQIVAELHGLSVLFSDLAEATDASNEDSPKESINELLAMSQRREKETNADYTEAIQQSKELSPILNQIISSEDLDAKKVGEFADSELGDADDIVELINSFVDMAGSMNISEDRIMDEITDDDWDDNLSVGNRMLLQIARNRSKQLINMLGERTNKSTITT
jgi:hypothetical protein